VFEDKYHLWYACFHTPPTQARPQIGYAVAPAPPMVIDGIEDYYISGIPEEYMISQNYPNPFNPVTRIKFELPQAGKVMLKIYNIIGQEIRTLVDAYQPMGIYEITWDGKDKRGQRVASGVYLYIIEAGDFVQARKMLLLQ
jgi:hypothetical protein